jgi:ABC-type lipoprotein release transport system permease subunit
MWARADLRARWRSWVVLGLLAGISAGLAAAAVAGARRTEHAIPAYAAAVNLPDAAVLPNDPAFGAAEQAQLARLPRVREAYPFMVPFGLAVESPKGMEAPLLPAAPRTMQVLHDPLVDGRLPRATSADEIVVNENARDQFGLRVGSTVTFLQDVEDAPRIEQRMRVVGIVRSTTEEINSMPSSAFYEKYHAQLVGIVNEFVDLRHGARDLDAFRADVQRITGKPTNVESGPELFGMPKLLHVSDIERAGLLMFALVVVVGAGALVGQALVRAVSAGGVDLRTWRAIGADRRIAVPSMLSPVVLSALVGALATVAVALIASPRFPIAISRRYELDLGAHADWTVLSLAVVALVIAMFAAAWATAELRLRRSEVDARAGGRARRVVLPDVPPVMLIGSRLATEAGRGRRAVPVRSALVGAVVGVLGLVGCLTFRTGLVDTSGDPSRSGIRWDYVVGAPGAVAPADVGAIARDPAVAAVLDARWARAVRINGKSIPTFGTHDVKGAMTFTLLHGHAPQRDDEIAMAPQTLDQLGLAVGDSVRVGEGEGRAMRVVGVALVPATSHTDYDVSAWVQNAAFDRALPAAGRRDQFDFVEDYVLVRWKPGADVHAAEKRMLAIGDPGQYYPGPAVLPSGVISLGQQRALPVALAVFFALLASATVAHALVSTVRRRAGDLAVLRAIGFTRRNARLAIGWQASLLALGGLALGVPLGIIAGRVTWRTVAENFPVVYVPPLALLALVLIVPLAVAVANALAVGPAFSATRARPAEVLRAE